MALGAAAGGAAAEAGAAAGGGGGGPTSRGADGPAAVAAALPDTADWRGRDASVRCRFICSASCGDNTDVSVSVMTVF